MGLIFFKRAIKGLFFGCVFTALSLFVFAFVQSRQEDPRALTVVYSWIALIIGAFVCGRASVCEEKRFLQALTSAALFSAGVLLLSLIFTENGASVLPKILICFVLAFTGAMLFTKREARRTTYHRARSRRARY